MTIPSDKAVWLAWGRQVRPGSVVLSLVTGSLGVNAVLSNTNLSGPWETFVGIIALVSAGALWAGWWGRSINTALAGYLLACWTWAVVMLTAWQQLGIVQTTISSGCWSLLGGLLWLRDRREET